MDARFEKTFFEIVTVNIAFVQTIDDFSPGTFENEDIAGR